ncbi:NIPSNAP family protein [Roseomonas eburnea]|uniref:NIPSNAP family protein n=1 Tax=Neoroseomonas eburnea TaxID=1346889 RepID=A0A9X9X5D9_9PROT|nr:NIPSNAP family protein [Neoroseomonas eburnea]MBR0678925.1 NIPSNAP family protein [Neoroseomonas eburnea]
MYIEHRQYTFHPGKQPQWLDAFANHGFPSSVRTLGAPSLGTFTAEVGPINRFVFMRGWDDIDTRDAGLAAREADPQWAEFKKHSAGCLMSQEVKFLKPTGFSPITSAKDFVFKREIGGSGMIVDHRTYDFHPGKMPAWIKAYEEIGLPVQKRLLGQLLMFAVTEIGPINQVVFMWLYEGFGDRDRRRTAMANDPQWQEFGKLVGGLGALKQQTVMALKPTSFSVVK